MKTKVDIPTQASITRITMMLITPGFWAIVVGARVGARVMIVEFVGAGVGRAVGANVVITMGETFKIDTQTDVLLK